MRELVVLELSRTVFPFSWVSPGISAPFCSRLQGWQHLHQPPA